LIKVQRSSRGSGCDSHRCNSTAGHVIRNTCIKNDVEAKGPGVGIVSEGLIPSICLVVVEVESPGASVGFSVDVKGQLSDIVDVVVQEGHLEVHVGIKVVGGGVFGEGDI